MNWILEINNINQLLGFIADVISIVGISSIGVFIYKKINVSITYNNFYNPSLIHSSKISDEFRYPEGIRSNLFINVK